MSMKKLSSFEAHVSVDRENATLMVKVFIFVYINMAFTVLIAFGYIPNVPYGLQVFL
jgi:fatty acid desaturase